MKYFKKSIIPLIEKRCIPEPENSLLNENILLSISSDLDLKNNYSPYTQKIELSLFDEVDKFCEKFIKIYPKNKIILSYYRRNLFKIGKYIDGLKAFEKETGVIELDNDKIKII